MLPPTMHSLHDTDQARLAPEATRLVVAGVWLPVLPHTASGSTPDGPPHKVSHTAPLSVRDFLHGTLGLDSAYVRERVQTILCNGLAVDDLDAPLPANARLALSAAMPGVVGATLRVGGQYAPMRRDITLKADVTSVAASAPVAPFWVQVRYFNSVADEQGLALLRRGVAAQAVNFGPQLRELSRPLAVPLAPDLPPPPSADLLWLQLP